MELRIVTYSELVKKKDDGRPDYWDLEEKGLAKFHQWGVDYDERESGPGNFTTAIIELDNGTIKSVPAEHVRFLV